MTVPKQVLVTGSTRGLGLAIVKELLTDGFSVVTSGRALTPELSDLVDSSNGKASFMPYDFNDIEGIRLFVKTLNERVGRLYGLVNNAAIGHDGLLMTQHNSEIEQLVRVNVQAPIVLTKYVARSIMLGQSGGRIINIGSIIGSTGFSGLSVYGSTKAAMEGFTRSLSRELGKVRITVNTVAPGYMDTDMTSGLDEAKVDSIKRRSPLGRLAAPSDVASAVSYLMSDRADSITGTIVTVDAGSTA